MKTVLTVSKVQFCKICNQHKVRTCEQSSAVILNLPDYETNCVVYGDVYMPRRHNIYDGKFSKYKLMLRNICHQSVFYCKDTIKDIYFDISFNTYSDHHMNMMLFVKHNFIYKPVLICIYNDYDGCTARNRDAVFQSQHAGLIKTYFGIYYYSLFLVRKFFVGMMDFIHLKNALKRILLK